MRIVRVLGAKRQLAAVAGSPIPVPLADGSVTLAMIQALIPLGLQGDFTGAASRSSREGDAKEIAVLPNRDGDCRVVRPRARAVCHGETHAHFACRHPEVLNRVERHRPTVNVDRRLGQAPNRDIGYARRRCRRPVGGLRCRRGRLTLGRLLRWLAGGRGLGLSALRGALLCRHRPRGLYRLLPRLRLCCGLPWWLLCAGRLPRRRGRCGLSEPSEAHGAVDSLPLARNQRVGPRLEARRLHSNDVTPARLEVHRSAANPLAVPADERARRRAPEHEPGRTRRGRRRCGGCRRCRGVNLRRDCGQ